MLKKLRARLKELAGHLQTLISKDDVAAEAMAAHLQAIKDARAEIAQIEGQIKELEAAEAELAAHAQPANGALQNAAPVHAQARDHGEMNTVLKVGLLAVGMVRAHKLKGLKGPAAAFDEMKAAGYEAIANEFATTRALNSASEVAGGIFVPDTMSEEIIEVYRPRSTLMKLNPRRVAFENGNFRQAKQVTAAQAYWRGEGKAIRSSQPTWRDINMNAKFLDALVPMTNQILRWSKPDIMSWVKRDMAASMGAEVDRAGYYGTGTVNQPQGILNVAGITRIVAASGNQPTVQAIEQTASDMELSMMMVDMPMENMAWVMSPRTFKWLQNLRDENGNRYYPELMLPQPMWRMYPVFWTTKVPANLGLAGNQTELALVSGEDIYVGESRSLSFAVSTEAAYVAADGTVVSAFQNDLTLVKASTEVDFGLAHDEAVAVADAITWGVAA